nr:hypothetical protein [Desulfobacula sp.]
MTMFLKSIPQKLNLLAASTISLLAAKIFYFNNLPEIYKGAHDVGLVVEGLLGSILASYIFYLIVVHVKETKDRNLIYPHIKRWASIIVGTCSSQLSDISKATGVQLNLSNITQNQIVQAMNILNPHNQAPLIIGFPQNYANWLQYLQYNINRTKSYIAKIMSQMIYIDSELVSLITAIEETTYFYVITQAFQYPMRNTNMNFVAKNFFEYCQRCLQLKAYMEKI